MVVARLEASHLDVKIGRIKTALLWYGLLGVALPIPDSPVPSRIEPQPGRRREEAWIRGSSEATSLHR